MPKVCFKRSGKTVEWDAKYESLLVFAEAHGVEIDNCCRCGVDFVCETRLLSGEVTYPEPPYDDPNAGSVLPCVCVPRTDIELDA